MNVRKMCLMALFSALIAIGAFIKVPISIVPVTLQTLFIMMAALVLDRKSAVLSVLIYIFVGLIGLPVFASGCGPSYVLQPSFGYLIGFVFAAYFIGSVKKETDTMLKSVGHCIVATLIIYVFGIIYFYLIQKFVYNLDFTVQWLFTFLFLVYLPGDIISCIVAVGASKKLKNVL